jgi:hypothetical protein
MNRECPVCRADREEIVLYVYFGMGVRACISGPVLLVLPMISISSVLCVFCSSASHMKNIRARTSILA